MVLFWVTENTLVAVGRVVQQSLQHWILLTLMEIRAAYLGGGGQNNARERTFVV